MVNIFRGSGLEPPDRPAGDDRSVPATTFGREWIERSREAYTGSTTFIETAYYRQWQDNLANFRSTHPAGSRYHTEAYKLRSRLFRPKTRAMVRRSEGAVLSAFFSTIEAVLIEAEDTTDPQARLAASIQNELVNYRLNARGDRYGIRWLQTLVGAYQDATIYGCCVSAQSWRYEREIRRAEPHRVHPDGAPLVEGRVRYDRPDVRLVAPENIRFDHAADWTNPVGTSPFVIEVIPMFVCDVKARMGLNGYVDHQGQTAEPDWLPLSEDQIVTARRTRYNAVRQERHGHNRPDPEQGDFVRLAEYDIVHVHRNIMRHRGRDWVFFTMGTDYLISEPMELDLVSPIGRNYVMGTCVLEAHVAVPASPVELGAPVQAQANELQNLRVDNIRLALSKRYFVSTRGNVDIRALTRAVPGSYVTMNDVNASVKEQTTADVTASSYEEQDRLNLDYDEIVGNFSSGSVQSNRSLNETATGMALLSRDSDSVSDFSIKLFGETWVEPVVSQIRDLEVLWESDPQVIAIAGAKSQEWRSLRVQHPDRVMMPSDLRGRTRTKVDTSLSSLDPDRRLKRILAGFETLGTAAPATLARVDFEKTSRMVWGSLGFEPEQFFRRADEEEDPKVVFLQKQLQEVSALLETKMAEIDRKAQHDMQLQRERLSATERLRQAELGATMHTSRENNAVTWGQALLEADTRMDVEELKRDSDQYHEAMRLDQEERQREGQQIRDDRRFEIEHEQRAREADFREREVQKVEGERFDQSQVTAALQQMSELVAGFRGMLREAEFRLVSGADEKDGRDDQRVTSLRQDIDLTQRTMTTLFQRIEKSLEEQEAQREAARAAAQTLASAVAENASGWAAEAAREMMETEGAP